MNWIPVKDQLPKVNAPVLMGVAGDAWIGYGYLDGEKRGWMTQGGYVPLESVTHWMPRPQPPTDLAGSKKPMPGGFSLENFALGITPEDAQAFGNALESADLSGQPEGCICDWHSYMVGDGCEVCNPARALEYAKETFEDLTAQRDRLAEALRTAKDAMDERRGYCDAWEWKYAEGWDAEDAQVSAALASLEVEP